MAEWELTLRPETKVILVHFQRWPWYTLIILDPWSLMRIGFMVFLCISLGYMFFRCRVTSNGHCFLSLYLQTCVTCLNVSMSLESFFVLWDETPNQFSQFIQIHLDETCLLLPSCRSPTREVQLQGLDFKHDMHISHSCHHKFSQFQFPYAWNFQLKKPPQNIPSKPPNISAVSAVSAFGWAPVLRRFAFRRPRHGTFGRRCRLAGDLADLRGP